MRGTRSFVARCFFAFLLVFGQHQAVAHALEHDFVRIHRDVDAGQVDESLCAECLAVAGLGHANAGTFALAFATAALPAPVVAVVVARPRRVASTPYRSRAPPIFA